MNKTAQWLVVGVLGASGVLVFACGGGGGESAPPNTGSASATQAPSAPSSATTSATTTATAAASSAAPIPTAPPLTVVAMKASMTSAGKTHTLELKADGSLLADGKPAGKITGAEMDDTSGQTIVAINGDNTLKVSGASSQSSTAKLNDKDAIEVNGATIISVADDGTVTVVGADGKPDPKGKMKFTGFVPAARRTACLLVFGMFVPMKSTTTISGLTSATPAKK